MEVGAQGGAVAGDSDGISRKGIADEVADGKMHVERQICTNEGKAAGNYGFGSMLLAKERAEMFSGALSLAVGRVGSISRMDELCVSLFCCSSLNILQRLNVTRARQKNGDSTFQFN